MTPTLARMVAARANGLKKPIRWFSIPQLFRYERQQRGRLREHFQLNCDLIGEPGPLADAEIIALAIDVMRAFGLGPDATSGCGSPTGGCCGAAARRARASTRHSTAAAYQVLDKLGRGRSTRPRAERSLERRVEPTAVERRARDWRGLRSLGRPGAAAVPTRGRARATPLRATFDALDAHGPRRLRSTSTSTIVRGLAYYTGTVFELFDAGVRCAPSAAAAATTICSQALGGVDLPALGFGMGDVVLGELLRERGLVPSVAERSTSSSRRSPRTTCRTCSRSRTSCATRGSGWSTPSAHARRWASSSSSPTRGSARFAIVIGPDDRARGEVMVKDLAARARCRWRGTRW